MNINFERWTPIRSNWKILVYIACFFFSGTALGFAGERSDTQLKCTKQLGFAGVAVKNNSDGQAKWVCGCRGAFQWNQDGSACVKRQSNGADTANQQAPDDSQEPSIADGDNNQPPKEQPVVRISPKKTGQTPPSRRTRQDAQLMCNKQLGFAGIAVKDNSNGQTNWICGCRGAFTWNQNRTVCVKRQSNGAGTVNPQQPVVRISPQKTGQTSPSRRTRQDVQLMCSKRLGFAGIAVKDNSNGQTKWVCECRGAFTWNQDGSACVKRQQNGANSADQPPSNNGQGAQNNDGDNDQPPIVKNPRKKIKRVPPRPRKKKVVKVKKKKRVVRSKSATARRYCRRRYGSRLVKVAVKGSKFYCHYKGKRSTGSNPRIKWKKIKFKNLQ